MKIAICGDVHISKTSSIVTGKGNKYTKRLENCIETLNWFEKMSKEKGCEMEIFLGDVFDAPNIDAEIITALNDIQWNKTPKKFICGNHEMGSNDLVFNSLNVLSHIGEVITEPKIDGVFGSELIYLPYILENKRKPMEQYINETREKTYKDTFTTQEVKNVIMFSHNDIKGLQYGKMVSKIGFEIEEYERFADKIINGHIHNQCQVGEKIINIGNITGQSFNEDAEKYNHTMGVLDTLTLSLELIQNPYAFNFYKFEILKEEDIKEKLSICKNNSVLSIKTYDKYIEEIKKQLSKKENIMAYKFNIKPLPKDIEETQNKFEDIVSVNYQEQFSNCMLEKLGNSDIVKEELVEIFR